MGTVYNGRDYEGAIHSPGYKSTATCAYLINRQRAVNALTSQKIQFLKILGLKIVSG